MKLFSRVLAPSPHRTPGSGRRPGPGSPALLALLALLAMPAPGLATSSMENTFLWDEANARMASASTETEFSQAAETYRKLVHNGVRDGQLFYNMGLALLKARQYDESLAALRRSERLIGTNPDIRRNMILAAAHGKNPSGARLPWYRYLLFWHYGLGAGIRLDIAVTAFAAFWLGMIFRSLGLRRLARPLIILSLAFLVLYGSSLMSTWLQESEDAARVVINRSTPAAGTADTEAQKQ